MFLDIVIRLDCKFITLFQLSMSFTEGHFADAISFCSVSTANFDIIWKAVANLLAINKNLHAHAAISKSQLISQRRIDPPTHHADVHEH